jgi:hypothetical protein
MHLETPEIMNNSGYTLDKNTLALHNEFNCIQTSAICNSNFFIAIVYFKKVGKHANGWK